MVEPPLPPVRRTYVDTSVGQIHVRLARPAERGDRRPLLCLHLSPGSSAMYDTFLRVMGQDRVALAVDTPGFGGSDPPLAPPTIADYAEVMVEVCDALGLGALDVIGYHTGSKIAVDLGRRRPGRFRRLVLVGAPVYDEDERSANTSYFLHPTEPREDGAHLVAKWEELWRWRGPDRTPWMVQRELAEQLRPGPNSWWGHHAAFGYDHAEHLPAVRDRVLVICPGDDLQEQTRRAQVLVGPQAFLDRPDWGHGLLDTRTVEVAAVVRSHLDV